MTISVMVIFYDSFLNERPGPVFTWMDGVVTRITSTWQSPLNALLMKVSFYMKVDVCKLNGY